MLRLYTGVAGTGKTREILRQIRQAAEEGKTDLLLIVPDQFTYEAERELCEYCGNHISMHAAAKSFSRMAMQMLSNRPDCAPLLDNGGRLLCMNLAIESVGTKLAVYGNTRKRPENQKILLQEMQELKTSCITADMLTKTAENCTGLLRDKLEDLALIQEAYESVVANGHSDPSDLLNVFAESIPNEFISEHSTVYIDGFSDFSQQELNVIETILRIGAEVTVCLNMEDSDQEIFEMAKITKKQLERIAEDCGTDTEEVSFSVQEQKIRLWHITMSICFPMRRQIGNRTKAEMWWSCTVQPHRKRSASSLPQSVCSWSERPAVDGEISPSPYEDLRNMTPCWSACSDTMVFRCI